MGKSIPKSLPWLTLSNAFDISSRTVYNNSHFRLSAICLQETWLTADSNISLLQIDGYNLISSGKSCSAHGGVAIYLHESFKYTNLENICISNVCDIQFIEAIIDSNINCNNKLVIGNIYRPPCQTVENLNNFVNDMNIVFNNFRNKKNVILSGDFNIDLLKFTQINYVNDFLETFISNGYNQK